MSRKVGSDGQIRKTTVEWAADTGTYPEGMRLMDVTDGTVRVSKGTNYALAWQAAGGSSTYGDVIPGLHMTYNTTRDSTGIGVGQFRTDNNTMGSVTTLYVYQQDADGNDQGPLLATLSAGGIIYTSGPFGEIMTWKVTACVDSGTFYTLTATYIAGGEHAAGDIWVTVAPTEVTGVKLYRALLTQTGTDAPVATVLENSLGGTVVWTRGDAGLFNGTLASAFPTAKTQVFASVPDDLDPSVRVNIASAWKPSSSDNAVIVRLTQIDYDGGVFNSAQGYSTDGTDGGAISVMIIVNP